MREDQVEFLIVKVIGKDGCQRDVIQCVLILWGGRVEFLIVQMIGKDDRLLSRGQHITGQVAPDQLIPRSALTASQLIPGSADPVIADPRLK